MADNYTGWGSPFFNFLGDMWKDRPLPPDLGSRTTLLNMQGGSTSPFVPLISQAMMPEPSEYTGTSTVQVGPAKRDFFDIPYYGSPFPGGTNV